MEKVHSLNIHGIIMNLLNGVQILKKGEGVLLLGEMHL